jgi:hypothetical protein
MTREQRLKRCENCKHQALMCRGDGVVKWCIADASVRDCKGIDVCPVGLEVKDERKR